MECWRITKARFAAHAFDGEGARRSGGRWNSPGTRMIYTAQSTALAMLEVLVHLGEAGALDAWVVIPADVPDDAIADAGKLPKNWKNYPAPPALQLLGDRWVAGGSSLALRVPSVLVEHEFNIVLNPIHPRFPEVTFGKLRPISFDDRLLRRN
jgi:RES domain-containing protein